MRTFLILFIVAFANQSFAAPRFESAQAYPGETYEDAQARHALESPRFFEDDIGTSANGSAYAYKQNFSASVDVSLLPRWIAGAAKLEELFKQVRDEQMYFDSSHKHFKRRALWLYPVDGCYTRAAHVARSFERRGYVKPGKVFAFGTWATLRARTPYAPNGKAWWSFHTAAAYRLGDRAIVLDPSIDPNRLLPFEEWVGLIAPDTTKVTVAICDTNAYAPSQTCRGGSSKQDYWAKGQLEDYLDDEWANLLNLKMDPVKLLGASPPWK